MIIRKVQTALPAFPRTAPATSIVSWVISMTDQERLELIAALDEATEGKASDRMFWRGLRQDLALQTGAWQGPRAAENGETEK
jgi:hypothetical protein